MSEHWTVYCDDCDAYGPDIRRSVSAGFRIWRYMPRRHSDRELPDGIDAQKAWFDFMEEHGWHRLGLVHE